jgi:hypothetical protein
MPQLWQNCPYWTQDYRSKAKRQQAHVAQDDEVSLLLAEEVGIVQEEVATAESVLVVTPAVSEVALASPVVPLACVVAVVAT